MSTRTEFYAEIVRKVRAKRALRMGYARLARAAQLATTDPARAHRLITRAVHLFASANLSGTEDNVRAARDASRELVANLNALRKLAARERTKCDS